MGRFLSQFLKITLILCAIVSVTQAQDEYPLAQGYISPTWSPDDSAIAFVSYLDNNGIAIYETENFEHVLFIPVDDSIWDIVWSPDGVYIAAALSNGGIQIFDAVDGELQASLQGDVESFTALAWRSTDDKLIGLGRNTVNILVETYIYVWDAETWELEQTSNIDLDFVTGGSGLYPFMIEFAFDETQIVLTLGRHIMRMNLDDLTLAERYSNLSLEAPLSYSINANNQILIGTVNELMLYDFETESILFSNVDVYNVFEVRWHPDSVHYLYIEDEHHNIYIRSTADPDFNITLTDYQYGAAWSNSGDHLAMYQGGTLYIFSDIQLP